MGPVSSTWATISLGTEGSEGGIGQGGGGKENEQEGDEGDGGGGGLPTCASMTKRSLPTALRTSQEPCGMAGMRVSLLLRNASSTVWMNSCSSVPSPRHALPRGMAK